MSDLEGQGYWTDKEAAPKAPSWDEVAGDLFNAEYKKHGPGKHEIEDMRSDEHYEEAVVSVVMDAYNRWASKNQLPRFDSLSADEQLAAVTKALSDGDYGSYRGSLPEPSVVRRSIDAWL